MPAFDPAPVVIAQGVLDRMRELRALLARAGIAGELVSRGGRS